MKKKSLLLTAVATLGLTAATMAQNVPSYVPTNGLVGWWPFNGNANDESGNNNNGTVNGATLTADRFGNLNKAYSFDGVDDHIEVAHSPTLNCSVVSVSVWFNTNNFLASNGFGPHLLSKRESSGWGNSFQMNVGINQAQNACWADWSISGNGGIYYNNSTALNTGNWFNLVYTHDGSNVKLFLNGGLVQTIVSPGLLTFNALPLWFGARPNAGNNSSWFNGKLDDIGIWNRALTQQEITALYNGCQLSVNTQPANQTININNSVQFVVSSSDPSATYQWQTDLGVGFQNLNSVGQYSGTTNDTLIVSNVTLSNNNQPFRCIISSGSCSDTSNVAVLTVNNNVGINEFAQDNLFSVYPNPAQTVINVKADSKLIGEQYTVIDNAGRIVLSGKIVTENTSIELGSLSNGIYLFQVKDNLNQSFRIIKN
jgi:hypothetical protein